MDQDQLSRLNSLQEAQINNMVIHLCAVNEYQREKYTSMDPDQIYFILFDLVGIGMVVEPVDQKPLLVSSDELSFLGSLEVVEDPRRLLQLKADQKRRGDKKTLYYVVRSDIADALDTPVDPELLN